MSNGYLSSVPAVLVVRIIVNGRDDHCDDDDGNDESICSPPKISWAACSWQGALKDGFGEAVVACDLPEPRMGHGSENELGTLRKCVTRDLLLEEK